jgi:hypothetical protein
LLGRFQRVFAFGIDCSQVNSSFKPHIYWRFPC